MLKVVGASWLQTRISTYILVAVGLLGIGAILLGEFGGDEKDGTYSATVFWNNKGPYRIEFWGQGNDLTSLPRGAARAYYKTRIQETGWSIVEIETSPSYPDAVQAYAAGLLEGSLTWQLIHHHWYNTIGTICSQEQNKEKCSIIRQRLRENAAVIRERANLLASEDPFWHMVRLFYAQLEGMEAGWRFAVRRSRRSVDIETEDFIWLAMASDLPEKIFKTETTSSNRSINNGVIFVKSLDRTIEGLEPIIAFGQNTVAPYAKMLRLLKRYTFGYHLSGSRHSSRAPTRSIFMSSYPGALSSHDEYYVVRGGKDNDDLLILASLPLHDVDSEGYQESISNIQGIMSPVRIMSANRLATEAPSWSRLYARSNNLSVETKRTSNRMQWVTLKPNSKDSSIWLIEEHSSMLRTVDYTENFMKNGFVFCDGESILGKTVSRKNPENEDRTINEEPIIDPQRPIAMDINRFFIENITSVEAIRNLMRGNVKYCNEKNSEVHTNASSTSVSSLEKMESRLPFVIDPLGKFVYRADLEKPSKPFGIIDNKMALITANGIESFEATSGPPYGHEMAESLTRPFDWSKTFVNVSRIGQPDKFEFDSVIPEWIWF